MELLEDPKAEVVDEIAAKLGLRKVPGARRRVAGLCVRDTQVGRAAGPSLGLNRAAEGQMQAGMFGSLTCIYWVPIAFTFV